MFKINFKTVNVVLFHSPPPHLSNFFSGLTTEAYSSQLRRPCFKPDDRGPSLLPASASGGQTTASRAQNWRSPDTKTGRGRRFSRPIADFSSPEAGPRLFASSQRPPRPFWLPPTFYSYQRTLNPA